MDSSEKVEFVKYSLDSFETRIPDSPKGTLPIGEEHKTLCGVEGSESPFYLFKHYYEFCVELSRLLMSRHIPFYHYILQYMMYYHVLKWEHRLRY